MIDLRDTRERLLSALEAMTRSRARERRLLVEAGPVYLITVARAGERTLEQEAVASTLLPAELKLSSERGQLLRNLGFGKSSGRRNWKRKLANEGRTRIADELLDILVRVYGIDSIPTVELIEDELEHPDNPELIAAMRKVAKGWDEQSRHAMYTAMLNATYLVPIDETEDDTSEAFHVFETHESGRPTLGIFTDWPSLRLWQPKGWAYLPIHGSEVFELSMERDLASMRINPEGDVGGELFRHEVEMLVRAVETFRRRSTN